MLYSILFLLPLLGMMLFGLVLLAVGIVLLLKVKNKLAGITVATLGLVFTLSPFVIYLFLTATIRIQG